MKQIQLTKGKVALVDDGDFALVSPFKWTASYDKAANKWYAVRRVMVAGRSTTFLMHRVIMDAPSGCLVDHKDGDGLNNQRSVNLRLATKSQNMCNRGKNRNNTSGYKGVCLIKSRRQWIAQIGANGVQRNLGYFETPQDAAQAYVNAAFLMHGEFARTSSLHV